MKNFIISILAVVFFASCSIEQDYHFEDDGEVKMDLGVDMSALFKSLPNTDDKGLGSIQDSINAQTDIKDSLEQYGITKFEMNFDTNTYVLTSNMVFKDLEHFEKFMNKDREEGKKPIDVNFSKKSFEVKNCASLISNEVLKGIDQDEEKEEDASDEANPMGDMDMSNFFTFKTTYHFPYEVSSFKSESGKGMLSEDKKSITFNNTLDEFTDENFNGDLNVSFK